MALSTVSVLNANTLSVVVAVNNGTSFTIPGTSAAIAFFPQQPVTAPSFSISGPSPGVFGPGTNSVSITPSNATQPMVFSVPIPTTIQLTSLQLYIYWNSNESAGYALLNGGQLVSMSFDSVTVN